MTDGDRGKPKRVTKKRPPMTDAERHKRFLEMARETEAEESPESFDRAFSEVVTPIPEKPK